MRAKFVCHAEERSNYGTVTYKLMPVTGETDENKAFFRTTPSGQIVVSVKRDETAAHLDLGAEYYVDFTLA